MTEVKEHLIHKHIWLKHQAENMRKQAEYNRRMITAIYLFVYLQEGQGGVGPS